ncbi:MAG TPA: hypothetical protein VHA33_20410 [Candidatus Angelobacter sp.]|jgi:hypothetical protein|nr:hypothetical protein [Candidatus Angelobacter sp.]
MKFDTLKKGHAAFKQLILIAAVALLFVAAAPMAAAQDGITVGGHVGFVIPWVTHANGQTTSIADNFGIGFPLGVTFKGKGRMALDLEMVPSFNTNPHSVTLTIDPGLVWSVEHGVSVGLRAAFDVNSPTVGFIPLVNKAWKFKDQSHFFKAYFIEADLPVKFSRPTGGTATNAVTFATHFGLGF